MAYPSLRIHLALWVATFLASSPAQAQIYKWTDANGQTHYSSSKADAGKGAVAPIKVQPAPAAAPATSTQPSPASLEHEKRFKQASQQPFMPAPPAAGTRSRSGGVEDGSDASRCALARDILDGKLRYGNGKAIDQYGYETAQNDVRMFCH